MHGIGSRNRRSALATGLAALVCGCWAAAAIAFSPADEERNFAKTEERNNHITLTPEFQTRLAQQNADDIGVAEQIIAEDPERNFLANICHQRKQECAGDVRFYDWESSGFGMVTPVLYTARNGATISGNVWATQAGPAQRPGIVLTTGSVQAPEPLYWGLAATLAKHGYVVLTYDVQGQGRSDTPGEDPDEQEGVPSQGGQPFFDGTEDGLDFLLSTEADPYDPRPSCGNANGGVGTDHSPKQERRVEDGLNAAFNPFWDLVDPDRIGIAGHSLGAGGVSYIGQVDDRVDAIVAWDNLRDSSAMTPGGGQGNAPECPSAPATRPDNPPITKPAIGFSNDYGLLPAPRTSDPDPESANAGFAAYKAAGVDSMQINTRGGTHFEYSFIPGMTVHQFGLATLRGMDMAAWYTTAWFDRHVKCQGDSACQSDADARLLSDRWRDDELGGDVDQGGDPNLYSFYLRSRYDVTRADSSTATCDDMRAGCSSMVPDGFAPGYSFVADAMTDDEGGAAGAGPGPCSLPQTGTRAKDTKRTLPPTDGGDAIRGKRGDDRLRGGAADDCLYGNRGDDRLRGDAGVDKLKGGLGRDRLRAVDGERDKVKCGRGQDVAKADPADRVGGSCERVSLATSG